MSTIRLNFLLTIFISAFLLGSCKTKTNKNSTESATGSDSSNANAPNTNSTNTSTTLISVSDFAYLAIHKDTLEKFFVTENCKKLVFRFNYDGAQTSKVALEGFWAKNDNKFLKRPPSYLSNLNFGPSLANVKLSMSSLEFPKDQYLRLLATIGTNTHLILQPYIKENGAFKSCILYSLSWGNASSITAPNLLPPPSVEDLNPSPPADPY